MARASDVIREQLLAPSLAGRLSDHYKPTYTCKAEDKRVQISHALEVMRDTQLGRKILGDVKKGDRLPKMKF